MEFEGATTILLHYYYYYYYYSYYRYNCYRYNCYYYFYTHFYYFFYDYYGYYIKALIFPRILPPQNVINSFSEPDAQAAVNRSCIWFGVLAGGGFLLFYAGNAAVSSVMLQ